MGGGGNSRSAQFLAAGEELNRWFRGHCVSEEGARRAVLLLDVTTLLAQPRPSRWNRRGNFGVNARCRYLWYRHAAKILGWCDRTAFPTLVTDIIRSQVFPDTLDHDEAPREDAEGGVPTILGRDNKHLNAG